MNQSREHGQVLVEAMVAMTIVLVGLLGIFGLVTRSFGLTRTVSAQYVGYNLASEGVEIVKNIIERDYAADVATYQPLTWATGVQTGSYCPSYDAIVLAGTSCPAPAPLFRNANEFYTHDSAGGANERTPFARQVSIVVNPDGIPPVEQIQVIAEVTWSVRGRDFAVQVEDRFFDWRK